jgi:hypothetical protein
MGANTPKERMRVSMDLNPTMRAFEEGYGGQGFAGSIGRKAAQNAIRSNVEETLGDAAGGTVKGLSKFATNLIALGIPLDKKIIRATLDPASLKALGASKNMALTGPYTIKAKLEPTAQMLDQRVSGLLSGTKKRLSKTEVPEQIDLKTSVDDLVNAADNEISTQSQRLLSNIEVPVDDSLSALEAIARKPTHLIDDWQKFRADNPNVPFSLLRFAPKAKGYFAMGPAGEHPLSVAGAEKIGTNSRWLDVPEVNDIMFWLHMFPNIRKGGVSPTTFVPNFRKQVPGIADVVMPPGGYVSEAFNKAIEQTIKFNPEFIKRLEKLDLDQMIRDIGKFDY